MYNNALLCSIRWALRKPLRNVVIERGGVVENVGIANRVFFLFFFFPCSACSFWKMDQLAKNKCCLADLHLLFSSSARDREVFFKKLLNESLWLFLPYPSLPLCCVLLASFLVSLKRLFWRMAESLSTCRRTCFHWISQCSSLHWVFLSSLSAESCTAEATPPPLPEQEKKKKTCWAIAPTGGLSKASL